MRNKEWLKAEHSLEINNFDTLDDQSQFISLDLNSYGRTLTELLENAVYFKIDQDGGELGDMPAQDTEAARAIINWYEREMYSANLGLLEQKCVRYEISRARETYLGHKAGSK